MRSFLNFLRDDKGSPSFEFLLWVPIFVALLIIVMDATTLYISQTEMENVARDTARRIVKGLPPDLARANALNSMSLRDLPYSVVATFDPAIGADVTIALQSGDKSYLAYANTLMILGTTIGARVHTDDWRARSYSVDPTFGNEMSVTIAVSISQAVFFGVLFEPILGKALVTTATVSSETRLIGTS